MRPLGRAEGFGERFKQGRAVTVQAATLGPSVLHSTSHGLSQNGQAGMKQALESDEMLMRKKTGSTLSVPVASLCREVVAGHWQPPGLACEQLQVLTCS